MSNKILKAAIMFMILAGTLPACKKSSKLEVDFTATQNCGGQLPCVVKFNNNSSGAESYQWDFGDGTKSTEQSPSHTYTTPLILSYNVTLTVTGGGKELKISKVITLTSTLSCETKGTFVCAKKLQSGLTSSDRFTKQNNQYKNYYYFKPSKPCVAQIKLSPVPSGSGRVVVDVLTDANDNSTKLTTVYGNTGETMLFYAGPVGAQEYYIRVQYSYIPDTTQNYNITYTEIFSDSNEINNTFNTATLTSFGIIKQGTILSSGDEDFYVIHQTQRGVLDVVLTPVPSFDPVTSLQVVAYNTASNSSKLKETSNNTGETMKFSLGPLDTGLHYLQVKAYNSNSLSIDPYKIKVTYDLNDSYEINNTFAQATPVSLNQTINGTIKSTGDQDFFSITALTNTPIKIIIPSVPTGVKYLRVDVYSDANTSGLLSSNTYIENSGVNFTSSYNLVATKQYFVRLSGYYSTDESDVQYSLTIKQ